MALSLVFTTKGALGLGTVDLFFYNLWKLFPQLSLGVWANLFHVFFLIVLVFLVRRVKWAYVLTFVVAFMAGRLIDLFTFLFVFLPEGLPFRILYFCAGFVAMVAGLALTISCRLPIYPFDYFTREVSQQFRIPYTYLRTALDLLFLGLSLLLGGLVLSGFPGLGVGTVVLALTVGVFTNRAMYILKKRYHFVPSFRFSLRFAGD